MVHLEWGNSHPIVIREPTGAYVGNATSVSGNFNSLGPNDSQLGQAFQIRNGLGRLGPRRMHANLT
jgi:hypothetical protein